MSKGATALLSCVQATARSVDLGEQSDRELLDGFVTSKDPQAFAALLRRHAPLVLAACRQVLRGEADVEDAFQATFLTLHQKASSIRKSQSLASWLFCVARRVALAARRGGTRRQECEGRAKPPVAEAPPDLSWDEVRDILHDEIERLPEHYRLPILLCYVEGQSRDDAARNLGWTSGTLIGRLERGRKMLRSRLMKRGVGLAAVLLAVVGDSAAASVSPALIQRTIRAITRGEVPLRVVDLLHGASPMILGKARKLLGAMLAAALLVGVSGLAGAGRDAPPPPKDKPKPPAAKPVEPATDDKTVKYQGNVLDGAGKPVAGAVVKHRGKEVARSDAQGRFEYTAMPETGDFGPIHAVFVTVDGRAADWALLRDDPKLTFHLTDTIPIRGRLVDLEGKPITKAKVTVTAVETDPSGNIKAFLNSFKAYPQGAVQELKSWRLPSQLGLAGGVVTDAQGRFEIKGVGRGQILALTVAATGFENTTLRAVADESFDAKELAGRYLQDQPGRYRQPRPMLVAANFEYALRPTRPIVGTVRDAATGKPLAGVQVDGAADGAWGEDRATPVKTDAQGRYKLLGLPKASLWRLNFYPPMGTSFLRMVRSIGDAEGLGEVTADAAMIRGVKLAGRVVDKATGKGVAQIAVHYSPLQGNKLIESSKDFLYAFSGTGHWTDADGRFNLAVAPGPGLISVATDTRYMPDAAYTHAAIRKEDKAREYGDAEGTFGGAFLGPGNEIISLLTRNAYQIIDPPAEAADFKCELQLDPGVTVNGKVVDADGKPLAGARAGGLRPTWDKPQTLTSDSFIARAVDPEHPRTIAAIHDRRKLAGAMKVGANKDVTLRLEPWGVLTGRALDEDGQPIVGADVRVFYQNNALSALSQERWPYLKPLKTDAEGRFRFEGIIPGQKLGFSIARGQQFLGIGQHNRVMTVDAGQTCDLGDVKCKKMGE